jgi:transposase InsO family protein
VTIAGGFVYLAAILDAWSRRVVGYGIQPLDRCAAHDRGAEGGDPRPQACCRMRDELLNETLFFGLDHARQTIGTWANDYNTARPHSSLGYRTPAAYAATLTATGARLRNPDQLRRVPVALTAPKGVSTAEALTAAG